jgi:hypothetical protein
VSSLPEDSPQKSAGAGSHASVDNPITGTGLGEALERAAVVVQGPRESGGDFLTTGIRHFFQDNLPDLLDIVTRDPGTPLDKESIYAVIGEVAEEAIKGNLYKPGSSTISARLSEAAGSTRSAPLHGSSGSFAPVVEFAHRLTVRHLDAGGPAFVMPDGTVSFIGDRDQAKFGSRGGRPLTPAERKAVKEVLVATEPTKNSKVVLESGRPVIQQSTQQGRGGERAGGGENAVRLFSLTDGELERVVNQVGAKSPREVERYLRSFRCKKGESHADCVLRMTRMASERFNQQ